MGKAVAPKPKYDATLRDPAHRPGPWNLSASRLKAYHESPLSGLDYDHIEFKATEAMIKGRAFEHLVCKPGTFKDHYALTASSTMGTKVNSQLAEQLAIPEEHILGVGAWDDIHYMRDSLMLNSRANEMVGAATSFQRRLEARLAYKPGEFRQYTGIMDLEVPDLIVDMKSMGGTPDKLAEGEVDKTGYYKGWPLQAALYTDLWEPPEGGAWPASGDPPGFVFIVTLSGAPYTTAVIDVDADALKLGRAMILKGLEHFALAEGMTRAGCQPTNVRMGAHRWATEIR